MKGKVIKGMLLVEQLDKQEKIGSIYLAPISDKQKIGRVVLSNGETVEVGDVIYFVFAVDVKVHNKDYKLVKESQVLYIE